MENVEKLRREEARRLIKWIKDNENEWGEIVLALTDENALVAQEMKDAIRILRENGFYQLLVPLLYSRNDIIERAIEKSILSGIDKIWGETTVDKMVNTLVENIG
ncbi:MAG: hypothetical protein KHZ58_07815 [Hungatella hathewayi]|nr:hypothetical protein [Hungatella hathewayi]